MFAFLFFTFISIGALFFAIAPMLAKTNFFAARPARDLPASVFFVESSKPEDLKETFANAYGPRRKLRILLVPGHDNEYWGTQFQDVKEADMTLALSLELGRLLSQDSEFDVNVTRTEIGYTSLFSSYFSQQQRQILAFADEKKKIMSGLVSAGLVSKENNGVFHNKAVSPVVLRLYGVNKWANENRVDLVVHIHFNDYPRRKKAYPGDYSGFSIYVPERQYSNARASKAVADSVSKQLQTYYPESNMPKEDAGVVEDQDLIAIGAFNTLDSAAILIEYGYIYEPQFLEKNIRGKIISELALQTYIGIHNFFGGATTTIAGKYNSSLLPYTWKTLVEPGVRHNSSVLSLQAALSLEGVYPPQNFDKHDCPLSGTYGKCTWKSLALFQKKYGLAGEQGRLGDATILKLNELYSQ